MKKALSLFLCAVMLITSCFSVNISALAAGEYVTLNVAPQNNGDASEVIQYALDTAMKNATAERPYKIVVAPGNYILSRHLVLYSNTFLECTGVTFTKGYTNGTMLTIGTNKIPATGNNYYKNITVNGGIFDGDGEGKKKTGSIFKFSHAQNVVISNATFRDCCDAHHIGFAGCKDVMISGCTFTGHYYSNETIDNNMEAVQLDILEKSHFPSQNPKSYDGTMNENVTVTGCYFDRVNRGVGCHSAFTGKYMNNINIYNNTFKNVDGYAIQTSNFTSSKIHNNVITDCGSGIYYRSMNPKSANLYAHSNNPIKDTYTEISNNTITVTPTSDKNFRQFGYGIRIYGENVKSNKKISGGTLKAGDYRAYNIALLNNSITLNKSAHGIWLDGACYSNVKNNSITYFNNTSAKQDSTGIRIDASKNINVYYNTVNANKVSYVNNAIIAGNSSSIAISNNSVSNAKQNGMLITNKTTASLKRNTISNSGQCGILCYNSSKISTSSNKITKSKKHGVFFVNCKTSNKMSKDTIESSSKYGVAIQNSKASLSSVKSQKNKVYGIYLTQKSSAGINKCTVSSNSKEGIYATQKSNASIKSTTVSSNKGNGIYFTNSAKGSVKSSTVKKNKKYGIYKTKKAGKVTLSKVKYSGNKGGKLKK